MSGPIYAFFDFDGTLIEGDSILYWLRFYYHHRPSRRVFQIANWLGLILRLAHIISSNTLKRVFLWPMSFERPEALDSLAADFVRENLARRFHLPVLERLREHHRQGHHIVVISASATFYLRHLESLFPASCILLGTELDWISGFPGLPVYRDGNLRGENKIRLLKKMGLGESGRGGYAYSDHHHDIPLLRFAEFPTCVRPTLRLRRFATASGWPIWDWPRERPAWRLKLESLWLLLFA